VTLQNKTVHYICKEALKTNLNISILKEISNWFLLVIFIFCISNSGQSTHLVGGELYYNHISGNTYELVLIVYRDCDSDNVNDTQFDGVGQIDDPVIGVYSNGSLISTETLPFSFDIVESIPIGLENPCFILPPDLCIEKATYTTSVNLPPTPGGYDLVYQRCCRNNSIINLQFAEDSGMTLSASIPGSETSAQGINESARFNNLPNVALCLGAEFFYDHSATDPDGDQLSYEFCAPQLGGGSNVNANNGEPDSPQPNPPLGPPFIPVLWETGFNSDYQVSSSPVLSIDASTGQITGTPTQVGTYAAAVCVKEYRNGQLINSIIRDFQYEVTTCDPVIIAAIPEQEQFCDGLTFQFDNTSFNASFFQWDFGDPFTNQDTSSLESPLYTYNQAGVYDVMLIANPGWSCADTSMATYDAFPPLEVYEPTVDFNCENNSPVYTVTGDGNFDFNNSVLEWEFPPAFNASGVSGLTETITSPNPGTYGINLVVAENGCEDEYPFNIEVPEPPQAILPAQSLFCEGFTFDFINNSTNAEEYSWDFGVIGSSNDVSNLFQPSFTYPDSGSYVVTLEAFSPMTCPDITQTNFDIQELLDPFFENPEPQCFDGHSFDFQASGYSSDNPIFNWQFGSLATPIESTLEDVNNVTWSEPGDYPVSLTVPTNKHYILKSIYWRRKSYILLGVW